VYITEKPSSGLLYRHIKIKIYVSIILSAAYYGFETWSLTLREEHRPWVFGNRVLRRVIGPKWDGVTEEWKRLHNEELYILLTEYCSGEQIENNEMDRACGTCGGGERFVQSFGGET